jgi:hypothetical protein
VWNEYAREKIAELEDDLRRHGQVLPPVERKPRRPLAPIAKATGRRMRRFGEALEAWGAPAPEPRPR